MKVNSLSLFCLVSLVSASAWGQALNGTILGTVADASGGVVQNAKVSAIELNTNFVSKGEL